MHPLGYALEQLAHGRDGGHPRRHQQSKASHRRFRRTAATAAFVRERFRPSGEEAAAAAGRDDLRATGQVADHLLPVRTDDHQVPIQPVVATVQHQA